MKEYNIYVTTQVYSYISFKSDKDYSKKELEKIASFVMDGVGEDIPKQDNLNITVHPSVASSVQYEIKIRE